MPFLKKLALFFIGGFLGLFLSLFILGQAMDKTVFSADFYDAEFEKYGMYDFMLEQMTPPDASQETLESFEKYYTKDWLRGQFSGNLQNIFAYLKGESDELVLGYSLVEIKERMLEDNPTADLSGIPDRTENAALPNQELVESFRAVFILFYRFSGLALPLAGACIVLVFAVSRDAVFTARRVGRSVMNTGLSFVVLYYASAYLPSGGMPAAGGLSLEVVAPIMADALLPFRAYGFWFAGIGAVVYALAIAAGRHRGNQ
ncbi:MAG: hypothetical protein ABH829_05630 [archaeon]